LPAKAPVRADDPYVLPLFAAGPVLAGIWPEPGVVVMSVPFDAASPKLERGSNVSSPFPKKENASPRNFFIKAPQKIFVKYS
jgi:hypothetical protein